MNTPDHILASAIEKLADALVERIGHAEIILGELASGYWRSALNSSDPTGHGNMGERVLAYWQQYPGDIPMSGFREALAALMPFVLRDFEPGTTTRAHREAVENACALLGIKPETGGGL